MRRSERLYLADIVEACDSIQRSLRDRTFDDLIADEDARNSLLYRLVVIGEAVSGLTPELRQRHPEIRWGAVVGFRNRVVHGYFSLDWPTVWETATGAVPILREQIAAVLAEE